MPRVPGVGGADLAAALDPVPSRRGLTVVERRWGPTLLGNNEARFRLWAPEADAVVLDVDGRRVPMAGREGGWHEVTTAAEAGARYFFHVGDLKVPDPASRAQDGDVHDASILVDPGAFQWRHADWTGRPWHEAVVYELHPGLCGGFAGITERLADLRDLGVTAIELMPIADFPGARNWGYDGVLPYAPDAAYGTPYELKTLVDTAHGLGLMVFLDVVYNHFGPDGAYLHAYAKRFFDDAKHTPWGAAIDFTRDEVRRYFIDNALYWLEEFRFDGLRFDAVHAISPPAFLDAMAGEIRGRLGDRQVHLVLEHEGNVASHLRERRFDAQWTDDVHHCLHVLLTGESEGYYEDFQDAAALLARCMAEGFAYQGEVSPHSGEPRGTPSGDLPTTAFVICLQNHDQIGNRAFGDRLTTLAEPAALRAATALLLLAPFIPLLFMGEENDSRAPFLFFTDHNKDLAALVREGRRNEFKKFAAFNDPERRERIPDPNAATTYEASAPEVAGDGSGGGLHRTLLALRHEHIVPRIPGARSAGAVALGRTGVLARWTMGDGARLVIAVNLGRQDVAVEAVRATTLYETTPGVAAAAAAGTVPAASAVVFLDTAV